MPRSTVRHIPDLDDTEVLHSTFQDHRFATHCHDTFVVQWVEAGADWCSIQEDSARAGEVWVHYPYAAHTGGTIDGQTLRSTAIYPTADLVAHLLGASTTSLPTRSSFVIRGRRIRRCLQRILEPAASERAVLQTAAELFHQILDHPSRPADPATRPNDPIETAATYLTRHCQREVSIEELADTCGLSPFHLIRKFKRDLGITPHQFLISQRVAVARRLLMDGAPPADAALIAGFSDQSHLTRCFKRVAGSTPGRYRTLD